MRPFCQMLPYMVDPDARQQLHRGLLARYKVAVAFGLGGRTTHNTDTSRAGDRSDRRGKKRSAGLSQAVLGDVPWAVCMLLCYLGYLGLLFLARLSCLVCLPCVLVCMSVLSELVLTWGHDGVLGPYPKPIFRLECFSTSRSHPQLQTKSLPTCLHALRLTYRCFVTRRGIK